MKKQANRSDEAHLEAEGLLKKKDAMKSKKVSLSEKNLFAPFLKR